MEQQADSLRAEILQLRSDKASAVQHSKTIEEASEKREAERICLVTEQAEQLRSVGVDSSPIGSFGNIFGSL